MLSWDDFRYVKAIAEARSLAGAGEHLGVIAGGRTVRSGARRPPPRLARLADALSVARATKWLQDHADEMRIVYKINTMAGLGEAAAGGAGLVLLPCYIGAAVPGLAQLTPPLPDLESELWLITHPDLRNTARVRAFLDFCADEIARRRPVLEGTAPAA